ncbi:Uncharacterised protein [Klebsiella michiganensis]|nr:Uncharacterised protein [Klebsiella michiganensis]
MVAALRVIRHAATVIGHRQPDLIVPQRHGNADVGGIGVFQRVAERFPGDLQQMNGLMRWNKTRRQLIIQAYRKTEVGAVFPAAGLQRRAQPRFGEL